MSTFTSPLLPALARAIQKAMTPEQEAFFARAFAPLWAELQAEKAEESGS